MANRNNSGRTKKSHSFRPYDTSNSFVKRITAKVSEILPQPTSWVSRWFSPASKLNTRGHDEVDEDDDEEEERQPPPSKRLCFGTSETSDFSHQNNINRLSDLGRGSGEISPILSRTEEDRAVPGPSGLHLRHFVSSTPAIRQAATPSPSKVNLREKARDDASDESETTSGCSSLVPGTERPHTRQEQLSTPPAPSPSIPNASTIRRLSTNTLKATSLLNRSSSMNLSTSSQPAFDTYVFNNPLNRSGIRRRSIADDSCFYPGHTTFGGSSSRLSATADQTRVVSVKPSPSKQLQQDTIGTSALRILRALEQFSTPVLDAKRIPVRKDGASSERKRKAPQPYEELIYPSMPDLLRVKRREQQLERMRVQQPDDRERASKPAPPPEAPPPKPQPAPTTSTASVDLPSSSQSTYSLRPENSSKDSRHIGSIKGRNKNEDFESERVPEVNLPNVKLQLHSLPKFDINVPLAQPKASTQTNSLSTPNNPPFKFSEPEVPKIQHSKENKVLPVDSFKFSEPLEPLELKNKSSPVNQMNEKFPAPWQNMNSPPPRITKLRRKLPEERTEIQSNFKFEIKPATEMKNASVMEVLSKLGDNFKSASEDWTCCGCNTKNNSSQIKCVSCGQTKANSGKESTDTFAFSWSCKKCSLSNPVRETKCKSCGSDRNETPSSTTSKGFEGFKKPKDTWECSACLVNNKNSVDSCVACSTPKSSSVTSSKSATDTLVSKSQDKKLNDVGSTTAGTTFTTKFVKVKTAGTWECSTCLVRNKSEDNKCVACSALKPGSSATSEKPKPMFNFGIPPSSTNEVKPFNALSSSQGGISQPQFTFGIPPDSKASVTSTNLKAETENKNEVVTSADSTTTVSSSVVSSSPAPFVNSIKKPEGSWECSTCLVQNKKDDTSCVACSTLKPGATPAEKPKPTFSFGIPSSSTTATNSPITFGSNTSANNEIASNLNSKPQFTFGSTSDDKKTPTTLFGFPSIESKTSNDLKPSVELKPFSFMNSDQTKEKGMVKAPMTNLFSFGNTNKESKSEEMNDDCEDKPPKKKVSFGNPLTFEKQNTNDNSSVSFGNIGATKTNEISSSSNFAFTPFENNSTIKKDNAPNSNSLFTFGSSNNSVTKPNDINPITEPAKPTATFGILSSEKNQSTALELPNSNTIFGSSALGGFKAPESENKPFVFMSNNTQSQSSNQQTGGFTFSPPSSEFSAQSNQIAPAPAPAPGPSLFSQQQASTPATIFTQPQDQKPFVFNAPPAVQQPAQPPSSLFTFNAAPPQTGGLGTMQFGTFSAPSAPKFDPNIKPSFNFTGGATPSFSATPAPNSLEVGGDNKRKVRKAIRRTTQHR